MAGRTMNKREDIMLKDLSIENWIVGGSVFIMIFTIGCFVWFQFMMSTVEIYDSNQRVETQVMDETSETDNEEIRYIEMNDSEDTDTTGRNSTDIEDKDHESIEVTSTQQKESEDVNISVNALQRQRAHNTKSKFFSQNI